MPADRPAREEGMILLNVLLFVALASAVVLLMISAEDGSLHRSSRLLDASRARAAALGGEASAIAALRRDAIDGPDTDNAREPWAALAAHATPIRGGTFDLAITDAEDRLNVNLLMRKDPAIVAIGIRLAGRLGLAPEIVTSVADYVRALGPVPNLAFLDAAGLPPDKLGHIRATLTALPYDTTINMNSVGEELLAALLSDPVAAHGLIALRDNRGYLRPEDFLLQHAAVPPLAAFTSNTFRVRTTVTIGDATQSLTSLLHRRGKGRTATVVAFSRRWNEPGGR